MSSYNPCMECKNRYGREYSSVCDGFCDYAKAIKEKKQLEAFKEYWDELYGDGLAIANWHLNGSTEPYDNFYDAAMKEYYKKE